MASEKNGSGGGQKKLGKQSAISKINLIIKVNGKTAVVEA